MLGEAGQDALMDALLEQVWEKPEAQKKARPPSGTGLRRRSD